MHLGKASVLLLLVNTSEFFFSHRFKLAIEAKNRGYDVHVACAVDKYYEEIRKVGFTLHDLPLKRGGQNLFFEFISIFRIWLLVFKINPDIFHCVSIKPVIYGGLVSRLFRRCGYVAAVSGLGSTFLPRSAIQRIRLKFISGLYRAALGGAEKRCIFQNDDDKRKFIDLKIISESQAVMIRGMGVDLSHFNFLPEPGGQVTVTMVARFLEDKGVFEFIEAAGMLRARRCKVNFQLVGAFDPENPSGVSVERLTKLCGDASLELKRFSSNIVEVLQNTHIVCLPSYREGFPKVLMEAAAVGRAVVTTDVPGCRDAIIPGETGLIVPPKDAVGLADAIESLVYDDELRKEFGLRARVLAENQFCEQDLLAEHFRLYEKLC